jgi:hypothetical protein
MRWKIDANTLANGRIHEVMPYDAELIASAEADLANGETVSHDDISWD